MVVDAQIGFGNGCVFPAGPLREPVAAGAARSDLLLSIGGETVDLGLPMVTANLEPIAMGIDWADMRLLAFAGIGRPEKFFATLRGVGADLVATHALGDHQELPDSLMQRLAREAAARDAQLVTTEKDAVRLPEAFRAKVLAVPVRLVFDPLDAFDQALKDLVDRVS